MMQRHEGEEERRIDMAGNRDLTHRKVTATGTSQSRSERLIEEIEVRVREMGKGNNEKGSTAQMKIKIKITLLTNLQAADENWLFAYLS